RRPFPNVAEHLPLDRVIGRWRPVGTRLKIASVSKIPRDRHAFGGDLPFRFARQPFSSPFGEGVGFVKADMANWLGGVQATPTGQGEDRPFPFLAAPVERRFPTLAPNCRPAVG